MLPKLRITFYYFYGFTMNIYAFDVSELKKKGLLTCPECIHFRHCKFQEIIKNPKPETILLWCYQETYTKRSDRCQ